MMKKYILLFVGSFLTCMMVLSQSAQSKHEFTIQAGGGLSALDYNTTLGNMSKSLGGVVGVDYRNYINQSLSIGVGIEFPMYRNKITLDNTSMASNVKDMEGTTFEFRTKVNKYTESQEAIFITIPVMAQYQIRTGTKSRFYIAGGFKVGIPSKGEYSIDGMNLENSGYYKYENIEYTSHRPLGFGSYEGISKTDSINLKTAFMLSLEAGMKWRLNKENSLYLGVYLDYGLNDINEKDKVNFIGYNALYPQNFTENSILISKYVQDGETKNFISGKVSPIAIGVKLRWAFEFDLIK